MIKRDPKTGVPLLGVEDKRPILIRVKHAGDRTEVVDAETGRPIQGIQSISWGGVQHGAPPSPLVLVLQPLFYQIEIEGEAVQGRVPAHVAALDKEAPPLRDGQKLVLMEGDKPTGVLEVTKEEGAGPRLQMNVVPEGDDIAV